MLEWALGSVAALVIAGGPASVQDDAVVSLGEIKVRLWYEATGRLSGDVSTPEFPLWNSIIGEGGAEEPANDALITVEVIGSGGQQNVTTPLNLTIGREYQRPVNFVADGLFIDDNGRITKGFWARDIACAGPVKITARLGAETKTVSVDFACGE